MGERLALLRKEDRDGDSGVMQYKAGIEEIQKKLDAEREQLRPVYARRLLAKLSRNRRPEGAAGHAGGRSWRRRRR